MKGKLSLFTFVIIFYVISVGPIGSWLESTMVTHVLIQLPLLILLGAILADQFPHILTKPLRSINAGGFFGLISTSFLILFWMIPRWLDASLSSEVVAWCKYFSLVLSGVLLISSWPHTHAITRGVVQIELLAMLLRLGWLYLISPERLCNNYLITDQIWLGRGMLIIALTLSITWLIPVFFGAGEQRHSAQANGNI